MPKSDQLVIRVGQEIVGDMYQIEWPVTVERVEGQWLRISDQGGYGLPPISGWVSKEDVLQLGEAHEHYVGAVRRADAPCVHWLIGVYLESKRETQSARKEYMECLGLTADAPDAEVPAAAGRGPCMLDAAVRLVRIRATEAKSAAEAMAAADMLRGLSDTAASAGVRRPRVVFEYAEALRRAYHLNWSKKDAGTAGGQALFQSACDAYDALISPRSSSVHADPQTWRGYLGKAELCLDQAAMFLDQASSCIAEPRGEAGSATSKPAAARSAATADGGNGLSTLQTQTDIELLSRFVAALQAPKPAPAAIERAERVSDALAASIQSLNVAIDCFDEAVRKGPAVIEAYRDRSNAYLMLARSEATLAAIVDANADPRLRQGLAGLALPPEKLDRTMVAGRTQFDKAVADLRKANEGLAQASEAQKDLADAEKEIAQRYLAPPATRGEAGAEGGKKVAAAAGPPPDLPTLRAKLKQLRADAVAAEPEVRKQESGFRARVRDAQAALAGSYDVLNQSQNLSRAKSSAHAACDMGNYANAESLELLAAVYASQCNFDRAVYYQKLAVIFASEDGRPKVLSTLDEYRKQADLVLAKARAKTPAAPAGPSKPSSDGAAD
jgi:hypothetical protein